MLARLTILSKFTKLSKFFDLFNLSKLSCHLFVDLVPSANLINGLE